SSAIVVGIDNGGSHRIDEYSPWVHPSYGGGEGDEYTEFLVYTLKPYIDSHYRTLGDAANTGIIGSSMGGLVSLYAALEFPQVFGKAGIFSPSLWFSEQAFQHVAARGKQQDQKWYLLAGSQEGGNMAANAYRLENLLHKVGFTVSQIALVIKEDGSHSEWFWAREFPDAYIWLFNN
ncbi:MAG: alpha/beta hydrolase, partial [Phaeodactylibacter sp.]|nr:alpha/beta hydrolase [Phaeodactylibacter sp.]